MDTNRMKRYWRSLGLSTRAAHCLAAHDIKSRVDLAIVPDSELVGEIPNFGKVALKEVRALVPYRPAKTRGEKQRLKAIRATYTTPKVEAFTPPKVAILRHPGDPLSTSETGTTYHSGIYWPRHG